MLKTSYLLARSHVQNIHEGDIGAFSHCLRPVSRFKEFTALLEAVFHGHKQQPRGASCTQSFLEWSEQVNAKMAMHHPVKERPWLYSYLLPSRLISKQARGPWEFMERWVSLTKTAGSEQSKSCTGGLSIYLDTNIHKAELPWLASHGFERHTLAYQMTHSRVIAKDGYPIMWSHLAPYSVFRRSAFLGSQFPNSRIGLTIFSQRTILTYNFTILIPQIYVLSVWFLFFQSEDWGPMC